MSCACVALAYQNNHLLHGSKVPLYSSLNYRHYLRQIYDITSDITYDICHLYKLRPCLSNSPVYGYSQ